MRRRLGAGTGGGESLAGSGTSRQIHPLGRLVVDVARLGFVRAVGRRAVIADLRAELAAEVVVEHSVVGAFGALLAVERDGAAGEQVPLDQDVRVAAAVRDDRRGAE